MVETEVATILLILSTIRLKILGTEMKMVDFMAELSSFIFAGFPQETLSNKISTQQKPRLRTCS